MSMQWFYKIYLYIYSSKPCDVYIYSLKQCCMHKYAIFLGVYIYIYKRCMHEHAYIYIIIKTLRLAQILCICIYMYTCIHNWYIYIYMYGNLTPLWAMYTYSSKPCAWHESCRRRRRVKGWERNRVQGHGGAHTLSYMYMYVYVCIYMYIYVYMCICMYVYVYICMYILVNTSQLARILQTQESGGKKGWERGRARNALILNNTCEHTYTHVHTRTHKHPAPLTHLNTLHNYTHTHT